MATRTDFTDDEWRLLTEAPGWVTAGVMASAPSGPVGAVHEVAALARDLQIVLEDGSSCELVEAVVTDLTHQEGSEAPGGHVDDVPGRARAACRDVSALLAMRLDEGEATCFKRWLLAVGRDVSEAAVEGGFLGEGGVRVDEGEAAFLEAVAGDLELHPDGGHPV